MDNETGTQIIKHNQYHCPACKTLLAQDDFNVESINCPSCGIAIKLPDNINDGEAQAKKERHEKRCPVALKVSYSTAEQFKSDYTKNVSRGGMFIRTTEHFEIGSKMNLELLLPELNEPLIMHVEIVHAHDYALTEKNVGVGVKFIDIDPLSKSILVNYLSALNNCT